MPQKSAKLYTISAVVFPTTQHKGICSGQSAIPHLNPWHETTHSHTYWALLLDWCLSLVIVCKAVLHDICVIYYIWLTGSCVSVIVTRGSVGLVTNLLHTVMPMYNYTCFLLSNVNYSACLNIHNGIFSFILCLYILYIIYLRSHQSILLRM